MPDVRRFDELTKVVRDDRRHLDDVEATVLARLSSHTHQYPRVVSTVSGLTALGTGEIVLNTSDMMLYRYTGSAWLAFTAVGPDTFGTTSGATLHEGSYLMSGVQTVPTGTDRPLAFPNSDYVCDDVTVGTSTGGAVPSGKFTLNRSGLWLIEAGVRTAGVTSGASYGIWLGPDNGSTRYRNHFTTCGGTAAMEFSITCCRRFPLGTALNLYFWHNQGSNHVVTPLNSSNSIRLAWLRP